MDWDVVDTAVGRDGHSGLEGHKGMWCVLDLETTGIGPRRRMVEVACLVLATDGTVVDFFESILNPGAAPGATAIHGLRPRDLESAPTFAEVAGSVELMLRGRVPVGHNLRFDWSTLRAEFARLGVAAPPAGQGVCTARLAQALYGRPLSLSDLCARLGLPGHGAHRAGADARATAEVFLALRKAGVAIPERRALDAMTGSWRLPVDRSQARPRSQPAAGAGSIDDVFGVGP